jgi:antitoxin HigA-1
LWIITEEKKTMDEDAIFEVPRDGWALPPVHPGEVLNEEMNTRDLTTEVLALKIRVPTDHLDEIVGGRRAVSAETALRLGRFLGTGPVFWLNLQSAYDLAKAREEVGARVAAEVEQAA